MNIPDPPARADTDTTFPKAKLAILFSGGLDCTTLARMSHDLLLSSEPVDLLNVAFENPRVHKSKGEQSYELCPDRVTGRSSFTKLCSVCPGREWRFVAINVPYTETQEHRQQVITLMHPHNSEMDLSIAYALYFAARGRGIVEQNGEEQAYTTSARVVLSGLGADELFAGYTRHATAYNRSGFIGLLDELDLDIGRLGKRNLGRDDRVISHWSREVRVPFLDENLVGWALAAPVTDKCDFGAVLNEIEENAADESKAIEQGKKVLRCLAWKLGMRQVAKEKKRAVSICPFWIIEKHIDSPRSNLAHAPQRWKPGRQKAQRYFRNPIGKPYSVLSFFHLSMMTGWGFLASSQILGRCQGHLILLLI